MGDRRATLLLGRLAKGALAAKPQDVPLLKEKLAWLLANSGEASNSHAYRETRALFNHFPRRELLYADAPSLKDDHRSHRLHVGRQRDRRHPPPGRGLRRRGHRVLRSALLAQGRRGSEGGARRGVRTDLVQHLGRSRRDCAAALLLRRVDARASDRRRRGARHHRAGDLDLGGPRRRHPRADRSARSRAGGCSSATCAPRRAAASIASRRSPKRCRTTSGGSRRSRRSSRPASAPTRSETATLKLYSRAAARADRNAAHAREPRRCRCARSWRSRSCCPTAAASISSA